MPTKYYDIIIIGSGIAGLYSAYNIKQMSPETSFVVLEKYKKQWIGGRTSNETFYGVQVVTGAGIGRKHKDKLLIKLLRELDVPFKDFLFKPYYSPTIKDPIDINKTVEYLKKEYYKDKPTNHPTFKEFAKSVLGNDKYNDFLTCAGYRDYENEDALDVIDNYGMEDNTCCWKGMYIPWKQLVMKLCNKIGVNNVKTSMNVVSVSKIRDSAEQCRFLVETEAGVAFECNKVICATIISGIRKILPGASLKNSIYSKIEGQHFLRLYGKFSKYSTQIMKQYVKGYTIVPGPLQKIIPMDADKGVYMIAYCDNKNAEFLKDYLKDTEKNREFFCYLLEKSLAIPRGTLDLISMKDFYWPIGTHYYKPLTDKYENRKEFINEAQHPEEGILVVGEVVSENQGWVNGALSSVKNVLTKKWLSSVCN
jgi:hypothetical protein